MSRIFKAKTSKKIIWDNLMRIVSTNLRPVGVIDKSPVMYLSADKLSARGVDFTEEADGYEIRTTACSNTADYQLANDLAYFLIQNVEATLFDEYGNELNRPFLFSEDEIASNMQSDFDDLLALLDEKKEIALDGPNRTFHIKRVFTQIIREMAKLGEMAIPVFYGMIVKCQFPLDEFETGTNFMKITSKKGNEHIVQAFFNKRNAILENVKAILLEYKDQNPILVEPRHLAEFLPDSWELLDEYTVAARVLPEHEWYALYVSMVPFECTLK